MTEQNNKKTVFSAVKPSGNLTIGNYIGAVKNFLALQSDEQYNCYYCVADMHSITVDFLPADFRKNTAELFALFIAFGLAPEKSTIFVQSHVPYHAELAWILNCFTQYGELKRMTQFKDKAGKYDAESITAGLFDYPVLMAADILLYKTDYVPVGRDQKQHVELARTVATRFNNKFSPTFAVPEPLIPKTGAKIYSLSDPVSKMGKGESDQSGCVYILDTPDEIRRKFKRAVTDSDSQVVFDAVNKPGISNLLTIYSSFKNITIKEAEKEFKGFGYAEFKEAVGEAAIAALKPVQENFKILSADKEKLLSLMKTGAEKAAYEARKTISKVQRKIGFIGL